MTAKTGKADLKTLYKTLLVLVFSSSLNAQTTDENGIPYDSVEAALAALESNSEAVLTEYEGWKVFNVKENGVYNLWSFTSAEHPAHPSVVKRSILKKSDKLFIDMEALCESTNIFCEALMEDFKAINENIIQRESSG